MFTFSSDERVFNIESYFRTVVDDILMDTVKTDVSIELNVTSIQFCFRNNISTDDALINVTGKIINELDIGNKCLGIFLDLRKAFDTINHNLLLDKLHTIGVRGNQEQSESKIRLLLISCDKEGKCPTNKNPWILDMATVMAIQQDLHDLSIFLEIVLNANDLERNRMEHSRVET
ncbi:hypothetical protein ANN_03593 [Periplaneta americana]|uniref:Reverse transcriptase domain-containing protein n=1 Tax=Periplaneta americana TaxID=6978 RepID=A0ABQ8U1B1_PERAM|nr:hypothetical protein ANN_03593 [Periplaneta americana]